MFVNRKYTKEQLLELVSNWSRDPLYSYDWLRTKGDIIDFCIYYQDGDIDMFLEKALEYMEDIDCQFNNRTKGSK